MADSPSQLIKAAFEHARRAGKQDWQRMTIAVLKNRLLQLTHGEFNETEYGAQTMREFVNRALDVITIDTAKAPPVITLRGAEASEQDEVAPSEKAQVRADLWRAIMDYSRGKKYVWDSDARRAREALPGEDLPVFPTVSEDDLREWRKSFVNQQALLALNESSREKLQDWQERILPSSVLPRPLAASWHLQQKEKVVGILRTWFAGHGIEEPPDLLHSFVPPWSEAKSGKPDVGALRQMVIECIEVMSERELSELRLSPAVFLRAAMRKRQRAH